MRYIAILAALFLAGCATTPPVPDVQTQIVKVEVPVPCPVDLGPDPEYPDTDADIAKVPFPLAASVLLVNPLNMQALNQMGENMLYLLSHYRAGRNLRIARDAQKQAVLDKCKPLSTK